MIRNNTRKVRSPYYKDSDIDPANPPDDLDVCVKWSKFYRFILKEEFPDATLGNYKNDLFNLDRTDCLSYIKDKPYKSIILDEKVRKEVFKGDEEYIKNPYLGILKYAKDKEDEEWKKENNENEEGKICRRLHKNGKYCRTTAGSFTVNRRAAAIGCGVGTLVGLDSLGECNEYYDYDGLKDDLEDIQYILDEFESLSYLCAGQIISAQQCKLLENFSTQHQIYKILLEQKKKILDYRLYPVQLKVTAVLIITISIFIFVVSVKTYGLNN